VNELISCGIFSITSKLIEGTISSVLGITVSFWFVLGSEEQEIKKVKRIK
jgi:hypothetical protein